MNEYQPTVIGRERESAMLDQGVGPGTDGLRLSLLSGPSGLGKSTLLTGLVERAAERDFHVCVAHGRAGTMSVPFAPWIEALPELEALIAATGSSLDMEQIGVALVSLLAEMSTDQPVLIAFDDAQALDESSLALLPYAAGVSERMNLSLVLVEQTDAIDIPSSYRSFVDGLLSRRIVNHVALGPMDDDSIRRLVAHVLNMEDENDVPGEVVLRAQGNPWFAQELAAAWRAGSAEIPANISSVATSRLHSLEEAAQDIAFAISLCPEGAHIGWLEVLSGAKPREFVRHIEAIHSSGLIREDGDIVDIAHPLMRQALVGELSAAMQRAVHIEISEAIGQTPMSEVSSARAQAYHLTQAGKTNEAVARYVQAAETNEISGQLHEAAADYVRALDAEPRIDQRMTLLKRCALAAMQTGNPNAIEYWAELGRIASAQKDNEIYAFALFQQYWTSYDGSAMDRLERAVSLGTKEYGWSARAAACIATMNGDYAEAIEHDQQALKIARETGDIMLETMALEKLGNSYIGIGNIDESITHLRQAVHLAMINRYHGWALTAWTTLSATLVQVLDIQGAIAECEAARKYVEDFNLMRYMPMVEAFHGYALINTGQLELAMQVTEKAMEAAAIDGRNHFEAVVSVLHVKVVIENGDVTKCARVIASTLESALAHGFHSYIFEPMFAQARFLAITGDFDGAMEFIKQLPDDEPLSDAAVSLWLARTGLQQGRDDMIAESLVYREKIADSTIPAVVMMRDEIDCTHRIFKDGDVADLTAIAEKWLAVKCPLEAARTKTTIAVAHVRAKRTAEAIEVYKDARAEFARMSALADADFVTAELRKLGTRSRAKSRETTVGTLTKRELQIARLVASGMRNSEVAGQLFLAEKTVAAHLSNIYGKVEVNSRVQLSTWLKDNDLEAVEVAS